MPTTAKVSDLKVCIIGAGPSGTSILRAFKSAQDKGAEIPQVTCYEKQPRWGGLWNYTWRTGLAPNGEAVHGSMYRHLWSNGPKECLEFSDYHFEEHFGFPIPSFPPREVLYDYIAGRVEKAGVKKWVRPNTVVRRVSFDDDTQKFTVVAEDVTDQSELVNEFDYVLCCSGHFSTPNVPEFDGLDTFPGRVMHAHDYRSAEEFTGKRIMVIGTSYSAEDIASQCYKYGCKSVHCSWRTNPMSFHWPDTFTTVPLLQRCEGSKCIFKDGSSAEIDAIILCTGYIHHFPFMESKLRLRTANRLWPDALHNGVVFNPNPKLMYIGMQDQWFTFNMFDAQAWYARDLILGRLELPSAETRKEEFAKWRAEEEGIDGSDESMIRFQAKYVKSLITQTDYPPFDIDSVIEEFLKWEHNKHENIMTFRDKPHKSVMTGTMAPVHHTPWLKEFDDSIPNYVGANKGGGGDKKDAAL